ncbi:MAG TPA: ABC transporter permease [Methanoregulaceae archaeon]|nr:ABC transporter permease [Methanoregulaceae archaeon]
MSYLVYVAWFGASGVALLWLRDARIFWRTGLPGYRKAAYRGVACTALALAGVGVASIASLELVGLGLVLLALYLQGRVERERIWTTEPVLDRALGSARRQER